MSETEVREGHLRRLLALMRADLDALRDLSERLDPDDSDTLDAIYLRLSMELDGMTLTSEALAKLIDAMG